MKKSLLALAVLGAFVGAASAQSSVTAFGVVDLSVNNVKNGTQSAWYLASNQLNSNRLGFRGVEDLGGGMQAGFWLEAGMNNATGFAGGSSGSVANTDVNAATASTNSGQLFNRRSTASLMGRWGEVRVGRDYDPSFWQTVFFDANGANGVGEGLNIISTLGSGANTFARANNSVAYHLPAGLGGLYGTAMYAFGQNVAGWKYTGGRLGYAAGPFDIAAGMGQTSTATGTDFKVQNLGVSWDFKVLKALFFYNENKFGAKKQAVWEASFSVPVGAAELRASYAKADSSNTGAYDAKMMGVEGIYNLSKRTAVYASYGKIDNSNGAGFTVIGGTLGSAVNAASTGYNVGFRHSF